MSSTHIPAKYPSLLLATVVLTTIVTSIDATIANVALPHMQGSLAATQDQISWVLTSYVVASAVFIPPTGFLAARLGRQRLLAICVGGFMVTSMLCGAATSLTEMVLFRVLQGGFGAGISPLGQAIVLDHFPRERHGQVLSLWGVGAMIGPILGPTLGGYLTETLNWRWVFYVNVPICLLALTGIAISVPKTQLKPEQRFDLFGFGMLSIGIGAFQLMLDRGQSVNWFSSTEIIIEAMVAALGFYLFLVHIFTAKAPFIEPRLFQDRNFAMGLLMVATVFFVMMSQMAMLPNYVQQLMDVPVLTTGLIMLPRGLFSMLGMVVTGRLIGRIDTRWLMIFGACLMGSVMYEMSQISLYVSLWTIVGLGAIQGFGTAFLMAPMTVAAYSTLAPELRTEGASMFALMRNVGGSIGISVLFTRLARQTQVQHQIIGEHITPFLNTDLLPSAWHWGTAAGAMALNGEVTRQAASIAYFSNYLLLACCMVALIPLMLLFRTGAPPPPEELKGMAAEH